jgi:protein-L-isoaspartate(D-aspartate) O-methyltransferase
MEDIERMMRDIEREVEFTRSMIGKDAFDPRVMEAMRTVPRHEFIPRQMQAMAYNNGPVPIGQGQTISQPYIVALMTDLLNPEPDDVILEIGTGSGYQAAVLSQVVKKIYSIEIIDILAEQAAERLKRLNYTNVEVLSQDGYYGLPEHAPFDGIIVTAAAPHVPQPLLEQLKPSARLVIPVGGVFMGQDLIVFEKQQNGSITRSNVLAVAFVPLTGKNHKEPAEM